MKLHHIATFFIMGVAIFLFTTSLLADNMQMAIAYFITAASWFIVACYEYNERVFDRAIQELVRRYTTNPPPEE